MAAGDALDAELVRAHELLWPSELTELASVIENGTPLSSVYVMPRAFDSLRRILNLLDDADEQSREELRRRAVAGLRGQPVEHTELETLQRLAEVVVSLDEDGLLDTLAGQATTAKDKLRWLRAFAADWQRRGSHEQGA